MPSLGDDELLLDALEEFIHIPFEVPRSTRKRSASPDSCTDTQSRGVARRNASSADVFTLEPPTKRRRYDIACISNLIPQVLRFAQFTYISGS